MLHLFDDIDNFGSDDLEAAYRVVSSQRREHALRYHFERDRKLSVIAYLLLMKGLEMEFGITEPVELAFNEHGKPYMPAHSDIYFSLSHCPKGAGCALSTRPVGFDIERVKPVTEALVKYCCDEAEQARIASAADPGRLFIELWTQKESYVKLTGRGIADNLRTTLSMAREAGAVFTTMADAEKGYVATICGDEPMETIVHTKLL